MSSRNSRTKQLATNEGLPSLKKDLLNAKLFLQQSGASGISLFDHLSNVISRVIDERPKNVVDYFEEFSESVRSDVFVMDEKSLEDAYGEPARLAIAQKLLPLLVEKSKQPMNDTDDDEALEQSTDEDDADVIYCAPPTKDLCELQFYWNLLGIGLAREEVLVLACAMAKFQSNPAIASSRFWGKLLGLKSDYYVVECAFTESTLELRIVRCHPIILHDGISIPEKLSHAPNSFLRFH